MSELSLALIGVEFVCFVYCDHSRLLEFEVLYLVRYRYSLHNLGNLQYKEQQHEKPQQNSIYSARCLDEITPDEHETLALL